MKSKDIRSFVIIGLSAVTLIYQFRNKLLPLITPAAPASQSPATGQTQTASAPAAIAVLVPLPEPAVERQVIPSTGWGRNPFLTPEEIEILKQEPEEPVADTTTIPTPIPTPKPTEPGGMPGYSLTAIFSGKEGNWAMVDSRLVQPGDRLGIETVEKIKDNAVVLRFEEKTRELRLKRLEDVRPPAPKGEVKQ